MGSAAMRSRGMRGAMGRATMCRCGMRTATTCCWGIGVMNSGASVVPATAPGVGRPTSSIGRISAPIVVSAAGDVASSSTTVEAMLAPTVAIAPACPWAYAEEDPVIEISRPIKTHGRAAIRRIFVIAVGTHGRIDADANFSVGRWRQGDEQGCCTCQKQTAHCELMNHVFDSPHYVVLRNSRF